MKHCPNPDCPFLHQYKMVAEFRDEVNTCPDCGTPLAPGPAPEIEAVAEPLLDDAYRPLFPANREPDLVTLCAVEAETDALFYKEQLELQGIPAVIVGPDDEEGETDASEDNASEDDASQGDGAPEVSQDEPGEEEEDAELADNDLYEVLVLRSDLVRATHFLDTLETDNMDEAEEAEAIEDAGDNELRAANVQWTDPVEDETPVRATAAKSVTPRVGGSTAEPMGEKTPSRSTQWLLILVLIVVVIVILLFLFNAFMK